MTGRKVTHKDAAAASAVLDANRKAKADAIDENAKAEASVLDGVRTGKNVTAEDAARLGMPKLAAHRRAAEANAAKAEPAKARKSDDLLRPATKTVAAYVTWLREQVGEEDWAKLAAKPAKLAEVSLQNYGAYQAYKRAQNGR